MEKFFEILKKCQLFAYVREENMPAMLACLGARTAAFRKDQPILSEGQPAREVGILLSGGAQIIRMDYYGNRTIVAAIRPSQVFGEAFACMETEHLPISVVASEDSQAMMIDCRRIVSTCSSACDFHNQMIFNLLKIVAGKNILYNQKIAITSQRTTREKLMTYLLMEARNQGEKEFTIPFDRQALADYLEVERSGLSAEISKLKREGILETNRSWFRLL